MPQYYMGQSLDDLDQIGDEALVAKAAELGINAVPTTPMGRAMMLTRVKRRLSARKGSSTGSKRRGSTRKGSSTGSKRRGSTRKGSSKKRRGSARAASVTQQISLTNPESGHKIKFGGPTHRRLCTEDPEFAGCDILRAMDMITPPKPESKPPRRKTWRNTTPLKSKKGNPIKIGGPTHQAMCQIKPTGPHCAKAEEKAMADMIMGNMTPVKKDDPIRKLSDEQLVTMIAPWSKNPGQVFSSEPFKITNVNREFVRSMLRRRLKESIADLTQKPQAGETRPDYSMLFNEKFLPSPQVMQRYKAIMQQPTKVYRKRGKKTVGGVLMNKPAVDLSKLSDQELHAVAKKELGKSIAITATTRQTVIGMIAKKSAAAPAAAPAAASDDDSDSSIASDLESDAFDAAPAPAAAPALAAAEDVSSDEDDAAPAPERRGWNTVRGMYGQDEPEPEGFASASAAALAARRAFEAACKCREKRSEEANTCWIDMSDDCREAMDAYNDHNVTRVPKNAFNPFGSDTFHRKCSSENDPNCTVGIQEACPCVAERPEAGGEKGYATCFVTEKDVEKSEDCEMAYERSGSGWNMNQGFVDRRWYRDCEPGGANCGTNVA